MSANLLEGVTPIIPSGTTYDGTAYSATEGADGSAVIEWELDQPRLGENQTYRFSAASMCDGGAGALDVEIAYEDSAGYSNAAINTLDYGTSWARSSASIVIPSGMMPTRLTLRMASGTGKIGMAYPAFCMGSEPATITSTRHVHMAPVCVDTPVSAPVCVDTPVSAQRIVLQIPMA